MQCKDIPDIPILQFLAGFNEDQWCFLCDRESHARFILHAMPHDVPLKLARAKMAQLIHRKLVDGCSCGCRGDFVLTDKGREFLATNQPATGSHHE